MTRPRTNSIDRALWPERVLEFDLSGLPYSTIDSEFLKGLQKVLRFEGMLKYVALPRLTVKMDGGLGAGSQNSFSQRYDSRDLFKSAP